MSAGTYNIAEAQGVKEGTKVIIHLKESCSEFADYDKVRDIIKKYSSFVGSQLYLNNEKANELRPLWLMEPKSVDAEQHEDFYRYTMSKKSLKMSRSLFPSNRNACFDFNK